MSSPLTPRRRPFGRNAAPQITDEEVLAQLRRSLEALMRTNKAMHKVRQILEEESSLAARV